MHEPDLPLCYMWSGHWGETKNRSTFTGDWVGAGVPAVPARLGAQHVPGPLPASDVGTQGFPSLRRFTSSLGAHGGLVVAWGHISASRLLAVLWRPGRRNQCCQGRRLAEKPI